MIIFIKDLNVLKKIKFCGWKESLKFDKKEKTTQMVKNSSKSNKSLDPLSSNPNWNHTVSGQTGSGKSHLSDIQDSLIKQSSISALDHIVTIIELWDIAKVRKSGDTHESKRAYLTKLFKSDPIQFSDQECKWLVKINKHYYLLTLKDKKLSIKTQIIEPYYRIFDLCDLAEFMGLKGSLVNQIKSFMTKERLKYKIENIE